MNPQQLWQSQAIDAPRVTLAFVRHGTQALERRIFWRNAYEYGSGLLFLGFCLFMAWKLWSWRPLLAAGVISFVLSTLYGAMKWHRRAGLRVAPTDAGVLDSLRFQRQHLERQRDARQVDWRWWVPMAPGFGLMVASHLLEEVDPLGVRTVILFAGIISSIALGTWMYRREARRLQREIDALDSLAKG